MSELQKVLRQGDVVILLNAKIPSNEKARKDLTLALGEATGHHHTLQKETATIYGVVDGTQWIVAKEPTELTHQEHDTLVVPPGVHEVRIQREYHPKGIRRVID